MSERPDRRSDSAVGVEFSHRDMFKRIFEVIAATKANSANRVVVEALMEMLEGVVTRLFGEAESAKLGPEPVSTPLDEDKSVEDSVRRFEDKLMEASLKVAAAKDKSSGRKTRRKAR